MLLLIKRRMQTNLIAKWAFQTNEALISSLSLFSPIWPNLEKENAIAIGNLSTNCISTSQAAIILVKEYSQSLNR